MEDSCRPHVYVSCLFQPPHAVLLHADRRLQPSALRMLLAPRLFERGRRLTLSGREAVFEALCGIARLGLAQGSRRRTYSLFTDQYIIITNMFAWLVPQSSDIFVIVD